MISKRVKTQIPLEHGKRIKYKVRLESEECPIGSAKLNEIRSWLLNAIATDPTLTQCGLNNFTKLVLEHDGKTWQLTAETIEEIKPTLTNTDPQKS